MNKIIEKTPADNERFAASRECMPADSTAGDISPQADSLKY